ncbi:hypothetical protein BC629DRAFT_1083311 [Irpex lacteus]|nr:hypothetical protein BC629DRAFT_1083311 [Irpex lacteus]
MAPTSPLLPIALELLGNLNLTIGASVIFTVMNGCMFGITSVQTLLFFNASHRDSRWMRHLIFFLWVLDLLETVLFMHAVYSYTTLALINPLIFAVFVWSGGTHLITGAISNLLVSGIFTHRIARLTKSSWPWFIIGPLAVLACAGQTALVIFDFTHPSIFYLEKHFRWLGYVSISIQAASDISIMITLCSTLLRSRNGIKRTNSIINKLIFFSINTCILTCSTAVAIIVTVAVFPKSYIWEGLVALLPKFMFNSLLASLNSRENVHKQPMSEGPVSIHFAHDQDTYNLHGTLPQTDSSTTGSRNHASVDFNGARRGLRESKVA